MVHTATSSKSLHREVLTLCCHLDLYSSILNEKHIRGNLAFFNKQRSLFELLLLHLIQDFVLGVDTELLKEFYFIDHFLNEKLHVIIIMIDSVLEHLDKLGVFMGQLIQVRL